jgi:hypothetical protein
MKEISVLCIDWWQPTYFVRKAFGAKILMKSKVFSAKNTDEITG